MNDTTTPIEAVIVGAGHRALIYASYALDHPDELRIVGVADPLAHRREQVAALYGLPAERWLLDTRTGRATVAALERAPLCPCCGDLPARARIVALPAGDARALDAAARDAGADSVRLSDRLVWRCSCANCGSTAATKAVELRAAARVPDSVAFCMQCRSPAIGVELRDEFEPGELSERFPAGARVPARFALAGDTCLDLLAEPSGEQT